MFVATLIADGALDDAVFSEWVHQFSTDWTAGDLTLAEWIDPGHAAELTFSPDDDFRSQDCAHLAEGLAELANRIAAARGAEVPTIDCIVQPLADREKRLLVADMDSTMITVECIDELADYAGIKPEIAAICGLIPA